MKFSNLMLFTGAAWTSYRLVKNRKEISQEVVETSDILDKIQDNLANIQHNLAIIQEQRDNIKEMAQDLTYFRKTSPSSNFTNTGYLAIENFLITTKTMAQPWFFHICEIKTSIKTYRLFFL